MSATASVQKYSKNEDGYIEYFIKVFYNGMEWGIWKRYRDFVKFDECLKRDGVLTTYDLPGRKWWNRYDPTFLDTRKRELQIYLDILLKNTVSTGNSLVKEFLGVYENTLVNAKKQSFRELSSSDRIRRIVKGTKAAMIQIPNTIHESPPSSSSKKKALAFSRGPSLGTGFGRAPSLSAFTKRNESSSKESSSSQHSVSNIPNSNGSSNGNRENRLQSMEFMRTFSLNTGMSLQSVESIGHNPDQALVDIFMKHTEEVFHRVRSSIAQEIHKMHDRKLPISLFSNQEAVGLLFQSNHTQSSILVNILTEEFNNILEVSPKNVLTLHGSKVLFKFRPIPKEALGGGEGPRLQRCKTIHGTASTEIPIRENSNTEESQRVSHSFEPASMLDQDIMPRKPRVDLRLRRNPSDVGGKR